MSFRDTVDGVRRSAWLIVVPVVLAALVAVVLSALSTPMYRATAEVLIADTADGVERVVATELAVAAGSELRAEAQAVVGDEPELSVDDADDADVLEFTASSTNAANAAAAANVYADTYVARTPGAEVVDRAVAPFDPYEPQVARTVLLAALAGLVIGVVAALLVAWRDSTVRSERQVTRISGAANLAVIPRHPLGEVRPDDVAVLRDPNSIESEAYRTLRTVLDFVARDRPFTVLLVTSPRPGEGKSSVAANLAAVVAQSGRKVVLVDGDLRRPQVHRLFVTDNVRGLSSVLTGEAPLQDCVQRVESDRSLALLTGGPPPPDPAELLLDERLRLTLGSLAGASDLVVIDAPPVLPVADPIILSQVADATLLVATAGLSDRREWAETLDRLHKVGADVIGTVLLRPDSRVHATPSYRYAPSAAPAHWWVTEASRDTDPAPTDQPSADVNGAETTADAANKTASSTGSKRSRDDAYPWADSAGADELVWQDSTDDRTDSHTGNHTDIGGEALARDDRSDWGDGDGDGRVTGGDSPGS